MLLFGPDAAEVKRGLAAAVPIGRVSHAQKVAAVVAFLASDDSSYVLGANMYVDGGQNQI